MKKIYHQIKRYKQTSVNCGPNSLAQLFSFFNFDINPNDIIKKTKMISGLGTWDANLGKTVIELGFKAKITPINTYAFDPTWYKLNAKVLTNKLNDRLKKVKNKLLRANIQSFILYLKAGGKIEFKPISKTLLISKLKKHPILVGLCSTYLYRDNLTSNCGAGYRLGHFVIVNGYDPVGDKFFITDPWHSIPFSKSGRYKVKSDELVTAIHLGEATYDCTIMEIYK